MVGILDTNGYIIGTNITRDVHLQGLFPINSLINHSCRANTMCYAPSDQVCSSCLELLILIINTDILSCIVSFYPGIECYGSYRAHGKIRVSFSAYEQ